MRNKKAGAYFASPVVQRAENGRFWGALFSCGGRKRKIVAKNFKKNGFSLEFYFELY